MENAGADAPIRVISSPQMGPGTKMAPQKCHQLKQGSKPLSIIVCGLSFGRGKTAGEAIPFSQR